MIMGHDIIASVRDGIAQLRRCATGQPHRLTREHLSDVNTMWQQVQLVHQRAKLTEPPRAEILKAHNTLERFNADAEITLTELNQVATTLTALLAAVKKVDDPEAWRDAETSLHIGALTKGTSPENWFGGLLKASK